VTCINVRKFCNRYAIFINVYLSCLKICRRYVSSETILEFDTAVTDTVKFTLKVIFWMGLITKLRTIINGDNLSMRLLTCDHWYWILNGMNLKSNNIRWGFHLVLTVSSIHTETNMLTFLPVQENEMNNLWCDLTVICSWRCYWSWFQTFTAFCIVQPLCPILPEYILLSIYY
jgi:hypothetical protein